VRKLRYAMVGGGQGAFIGGVHRKAMALDGEIEFVAGALSSNPDKARASGRELGLAEARNHSRWQDLLEDELRRSAEERIDFVSIVTPNHVHYPVAKAFAEAGIGVVCDKPLVHTSEQAQNLIDTVAKSGAVFGVTYNYTGYPLVRQARHMVRSGEIGDVRKVIVEYNQGWLAHAVDTSENKQAEWRMDPARSGIAGAMGDIGSHAENLVSTITGLEIDALCAELTSFVPGRTLDDDASLLMRFSNGARGVMICSQVAIGGENDLRIRVFGTKGSLTWHQEDPNRLLHHPADGPLRVLTRGSPWLCEAAARSSRLPTGHPEAFIEAFANVYLGVADALRARAAGRDPAPLEANFPTLADGARGVRFIEKTVESSRSLEKWTPF
jgi:predicted dehydrogenase